MPGARVKSNQVILIGYLLGVLVSLVLRGGIVLPGGWLEVVGLGAGGLLGWSLVWLDKLAYVLILHPEVQLSQYVKYYFKKGSYRAAMDLLNKREGEIDKLTTRGVLFQAAWLVLALFAVTSVGSMFGRMLVMGLGLRVMTEEWQEYGRDKELLKQRLFWQIKKEIGDEELKWFMYLGTGLFLWLTYLVI